MINLYLDFFCENFNLSYDESLIIRNLNFHFSGPGFVMIEGDNGTGKSSLLKAFAGFIHTNNPIKFSNHSIATLKPTEFSYFTTTSLGLLNELTGLEHINLISKSLNLDKNFVNSKISEFRELEIFDEIISKKVEDYSQGMKQLLRFFLHIFYNPKVLFLDEPFLYVSPRIKLFLQSKLEILALNSLIFITDQKITWFPKAKHSVIDLDKK